jgi:hypothetical protein
MNWSMDIALFLVGATDRFLARADGVSSEAQYM